MKRLLVMAVLVVTALGFSVTTGVAASKGNGATVTPFTATYANGTTLWTCSGNHIVNKGATRFQDSETCLVTGVTTGYVAGTYTGTVGGYFPCADGILPPYGDVIWNSDYTPEAAACATAWTITATDNGNGTFTFGITAFYSS
jgi:hypothetical protein